MCREWDSPFFDSVEAVSKKMSYIRERAEAVDGGPSVTVRAGAATIALAGAAVGIGNFFH